MAGITRNDRLLIDNVWTLMALARKEYWSDETLKRAAELIVPRLEAKLHVAHIGELLREARERAANDLGVPPWNG